MVGTKGKLQKMNSHSNFSKEVIQSGVYQIEMEEASRAAGKDKKSKKKKSGKKGKGGKKAQRVPLDNEESYLSYEDDGRTTEGNTESDEYATESGSETDGSSSSERSSDIDEASSESAQ